MTLRAEEFSKWLREILDSSGISQGELARRLTVELERRVDPATVNKMVGGTRTISADELYAISSVCKSPLPPLTVPASTDAQSLAT